MKKLLSLLLILSFSAQANEVKFITKGSPAPFEGYIFDLEAEQKNQFRLLERNNFEKQIVLYKENEALYEHQNQVWKNLATENTERLVKLERNTFWQNALFFGLGVVATSALAIGLSKGLNN